MEEILEKIPVGEVLRYMGHRGTADPSLLLLVEGCARKVLAAARPRWLYELSDLSWADGTPTLTRWAIPLPGEDIRRLLESCDRAVVLCATLSLEVDRLLRQLQLEDMAAALAAESCATAAVEALCDLAREKIGKEYPEWGLTRRFSPGYGDLPLSLQGPLLAALDAQKRIGLWANESFLLIPRKSVTAVMGIYACPAHLQPDEKSRCESCPMGERCLFAASPRPERSLTDGKS